MALIQAPNAIVMVRPWKFFSNPETACDNAFQRENADSIENISFKAKEEFDMAVATLMLIQPNQTVQMK